MIADQVPMIVDGSGSEFLRLLNPPAIHHTLSKGEQELRYGFYRGSGGQLKRISNVSYSGAFYYQENRRLSSVLNDICDSFELTKDDLALVCKVQSRKTLYNWIDDKSKPRKQAFNRVFELSLIAKAWKQSGLSISREELDTPVIEGKSIFSLLQEDKLDKERILFAGSRLNFSKPGNHIPDPFA